VTLPHDIIRCHDGNCPDRFSCQRWLERTTGGPWTSHTASFANHGRCLDLIENEPMEETADA
jgi:hypothetical protein